MTKGYASLATTADVPLVAQDLREADVAEVRAASGMNPEEALMTGLMYPGSRTMTIKLPNGYPVGMYGVCPVSPGVGAVWMLAANGIHQVSFQFARESHRGIDELCQGYDIVFNFTDARNSVHHRWIKWAGFSIIKKHEQYGFEGRPFYEFVKTVERSNV